MELLLAVAFFIGNNLTAWIILLGVGIGFRNSVRLNDKAHVDNIRRSRNPRVPDISYGVAFTMISLGAILTIHAIVIRAIIYFQL